MLITRREEADFSELVGKVITGIDVAIDNDGDELEVVFKTECGETYYMFHDQDCCENVYIEDVVGGELSDLVGEGILFAEEVSNFDDEGPLNKSDDSYTWTFYKISTNKVSLTIRWHGSSNGYYSESVNFEKDILVDNSQQSKTMTFVNGEKSEIMLSPYGLNDHINQMELRKLIFDNGGLDDNDENRCICRRTGLWYRDFMPSKRDESFWARDFA